jgi:hypothetical protein
MGDAHAFGTVAVDARVDAPFQRNEAAGMVQNVAVDIEHEDVVGLDLGLVGAGTVSSTRLVPGTRTDTCPNSPIVP